MLKLVMLLKRRPDLTHEEFRTYYEDIHARIGETYIGGHAVRYMRRYLTPSTQRPAPDATPFDVITEMWFPDQAAYAAARERLKGGELAALIREDEARLFDTTDMHFYVVSETESDLAQA